MDRIELLKSLGFIDPHKISDEIEELSETFGKPLFPLIIDSPDPERVLNNLRTLLSLVGKEELLSLLFRREDGMRILIFLFGGSRFLSNYLLTSPEEIINWLFDSQVIDTPRKKEDFVRELEKMFTVHPGLAPRSGAGGSRFTLEEEMGILRRFKRREILRIGLRDLSGKADLLETIEDLTYLAEAIIDKTCEISDRELRRRFGTPMYSENGEPRECYFTVLGMGKLGGEELNFSSDIDLMYLYSSDRGETTGIPGQYGEMINIISNHEYFTKLSELITKVLGANTEDGFAYRVDLRLRPQGSRGDIATSLRSYELYYESWGKTWERAALTKVRPVAGYHLLGKEFLQIMKPFIYRKYLDFSAIGEIRDMKTRIDRSALNLIQGLKKKDVKRGYGGIREVEFLIQALQLIYGAKEKSLQERNSLRAMHKLSQKGLLSYEEYSTLSKAYSFLRVLEHRLQILDDRQIHTIPEGKKDLQSLAKRMGYRERPLEGLIKDYDYHTKEIHKIYDNLFYQYVEEKPGISELSLMMEGEYDEAEALMILKGQGFKDPEKAYKNLLLIRDGEAMAHHTPRWSRILSNIFPDIFEKIVKSPDPDLALRHFESFLSSEGWKDTSLSMLIENPRFADLLIALFSDSEYLSRILISHPGLTGLLIDSELGKKTRKRLRGDINSFSETSIATADKMDSIRRFKHLEEIRIGIKDLAEERGFIEISRDLTRVADVSMEKALEISEEEIKKRFGRPTESKDSGGETESEAGIAIIGLGKLGGSEITYGSDLDILFVYSMDGKTTGPSVISNHEYFSKLAERVCYILSAYTAEGSAYRVDTRLRPTGSKGPIAQSLKAFKDYYRDKAELWERQALTKTRFITGDRGLGRKFLRLAEETVYSFPYNPSTVLKIKEMKKRMEQELSKEGPEEIDLKFGPGGIVEFEFIIQTMQLMNGKEHPELRVPNTYIVIKRLGRLNLISGGDARLMEDAYLFLRGVESRLRVLRNLPSSILHIKDERLLPLARGMGYDDGEKFLKALKTFREKVREIYDRVLFFS
ncbi:MAG: bifunctional [glutamate--ammonia ligase]-adenylyl-L-tyrosine phosphorylase/[glutamate--ammonia-ligase] adenylyltransferase [Nitrospirae bacterium]|nr:bifunctional [glutamate--ammonia ligase]-adenylyl-L-tyrosine phosphorylase/[glutamate--ammonia-ligase] adenylyltransferase [Nitrospirota bacterium]